MYVAETVTADGKLEIPFPAGTGCEGSKSVLNSKRLHVQDRISGQIFLIDTGSDISLLPVARNCKPVASGLRLYAANNTRVDTYGESTRTIEIGLRRPITWNFCVADVPYPNVGADLLTHYGITVDLRGPKIIDALTKLQIWCTTKNVNHVSTHTVDRSSGIAGILLEFPEVTGISQTVPLQERGVFHYIQTKGHPVASRARRLAPGKLRAAKLEFRHLMEAGSPKKMGNGECAGIITR
ncbi:uncharacterized protein LOC122403173 [Colletes gigas]|uniref:uncharacterized protein LOC122403173 n=1 Tax=Colletes gigas TaxID=935657 RepID=UPI001C9AFFB8|nr:uncharacterized protein LOC122403173 [Colletes gigas]